MFHLLQNLEICQIVLLCILIDIIAISRFPMNEVVLGGKQTQMNCSTDPLLKIDWSGNKLGELRDLSRGKNVNPVYNKYYKVNNTQPGQFDLLINASYTDVAFEYICVETANNKKESAQLTIIEERDLPCSKSNTARNEWSLVCRLVVYGNWLPRLMWYNNNGQAYNETKIERLSDGIKATLNVTLTDLSANATKYRCKMGFEIADKPKETTATNLPTLNLSCSESLTMELEELTTPSQSTRDNKFTIIVAIMTVTLSTTMMIIIVIIVLKRNRSFRNACLHSENENPTDSVLQRRQIGTGTEVANSGTPLVTPIFVNDNKTILLT